MYMLECLGASPLQHNSVVLGDPLFSCDLKRHRPKIVPLLWGRYCLEFLQSRNFCPGPGLSHNRLSTPFQLMVHCFPQMRWPWAVYSHQSGWRGGQGILGHGEPGPTWKEAPCSELRGISELYKGEAACHLLSTDRRVGESEMANPMG